MTEQKSQARNLFFQTDLSKTQIADITKVPRRTLHYWIRENNWDRQKKSAAHMPALLAENVYQVIGRFTQQLMGEDRIMRPVTHKEADTLHKLTVTVNKLKNRSTLNESMEMFGLFMEAVNKKSPELAQQIIPFVDDYISSRADLCVEQFRPEHFNEMGLIPQEKEDVKEAQLDIQDITAWTEGAALIPEAQEQQPAATAKPEPLPKQTMPAGSIAEADIQASAEVANITEPTTEELIAEVERLIAELTNDPSPATSLKIEQFRRTHGHLFPTTQPKAA